MDVDTGLKKYCERPVRLLREYDHDEAEKSSHKDRNHYHFGSSGSLVYPSSVGSPYVGFVYLTGRST
jgi:hypothetical protein